PRTHPRSRRQTPRLRRTQGPTRRTPLLRGPHPRSRGGHPRHRPLHSLRRLAHGPRLASPGTPGTQSMTVDRFAETDRIFRAALRIEPDGRRDFVERQCKGDQSLLAEVMELLDEDEASLGAGPLDRPALGEGFALSAFAPGGASPSPELPESIGQYRVHRLLGVGGMGIVYEAEQHHPRRTVALKVTNAGVATPEMIERFHHEAEVLARLHHPGIAQIYEAGTFESHRNGGNTEQPYFAM